jgi:Fervidolysin N-terminal prodomain
MKLNNKGLHGIGIFLACILLMKEKNSILGKGGKNTGLMNSFRIVLSIFFVFALATTTSLMVKKRHTLENPEFWLHVPWERVQAAQGESSRPEGKDYGPGEVLVKFKPYVTEGEIDRIAKISGIEMMMTLSPPNLFLFRIIGNSSLRDVIKTLERFEEIEYSGPNTPRKNSG